MANNSGGKIRHIAVGVLGGFVATTLAMGLAIQLANQAEASDDVVNDHPQIAVADSEAAATSSNSATSAHVMLYQAGHKPESAKQAVGTTRHDYVDEIDDYSASTWSSTHDSGHVKRYDNVTIDVTNTGTGTMSFHIWEDVNNWGDYWCLHKGEWSSAGACDSVTLQAGENFTATVQPNQHQGPWPHYGVVGIYLEYWDSTPPPTPPNHHVVTDKLDDGSQLVTEFNLSDDANYHCDEHGVNAMTVDPAYDQSVIWMADAFQANGYQVTGDSPDSLGLVIDVEAKGTFSCG
jgi:hypothetical protein